MFKSTIMLILLTVWACTAFAKGGVPASIDQQTAILLDELSSLRSQLDAVQGDLDFVKRRLKVEPTVMTVCGSSSIFAEAAFDGGGSVGAGGNAGPGIDLQGTGVESRLAGNVVANQVAGVGGATHASFDVCVDLNELAYVIADKIDADEPLTDEESDAWDLYNNSAGVQSRLLQMAGARLKADALAAEHDADSTLYALTDQIDYLDQNVSDATLLPVRIELLASSGLLVPLPANMQDRLASPLGVVPDVDDLENSCNTLGATLQSDVCGDIANLGGVSLSGINAGINAVGTAVDAVSTGVTQGFNTTQAGFEEGFEETNQGLDQGFSATQQFVGDSSETVAGVVQSSNSTLASLFDSGFSGIQGVLASIEDIVSGLQNPFSSGGSGGSGGGGQDCRPFIGDDWWAGDC